MVTVVAMLVVVDAGAQSKSPTVSLQGLTETFDTGVTQRSWKYIVMHHSASATGSVESIDAAHRQRLDSAGQPWRGVGYHFVIGNGNGMRDGEVASTFRWREQSDGAHAGVATFNQHGIGICLIGDFESSGPTEAQLDSLRRLIDILRQEYGIDDDRLLTHRDVRPTACPGGKFPLARIRANSPEVLKASQEK